jgi:hypothetical protein
VQAGERQAGLFAYPWDVLDTGTDAFADSCSSLGITDIHLTTCYHSGKFLLPRNTRRKVYFPQPGCLYFQPPADAFEHSLSPPVSDLASGRWLEDLSGAARSRNIRLSAWTVFFHNSALGQKHPDLTLRNLFGDPYPFALCPTQPRVQQYAVDLCRSLTSTGYFSAIDLESLGYLGYDHGYHHEVDAIPLGPLERFLLSLCFCDACRNSASHGGIQLDALQKTLKKTLNQRFKADDLLGSDPHNAEQIATMLAILPDLRALIALRCSTIEGLVQRIRSECSGCELNLFSSSFVGSPSNIWREGIDIRSIQPLVDRFVMLAYNASDAIKTDLLFCSELVEDLSKLNLTLNLGVPATASLAHAVEILEFALKQGINSFSFFNYGFLGERRLQWLRPISELIRVHPGPPSRGMNHGE